MWDVIVERIGKSARGRVVRLLMRETLRSLAGVGRQSKLGGNGSLAGHVAAALYDQLCGHDEPRTPDTKRQGRWRR
jgi:hypothetical protein